MKLQELIPPARIRLDIQANTPEEVIKILVDALAETHAIDDPEAVKRSVLKREKQVGTGIGYGVAIPHTEPGSFPQPLVVFGRLAKPIDFHAPDRKKARLVFLLLTPDRTPALHVRLLARICRLTRSRVLRNRLLEVSSPEEAADTIAELEADYPELTP